MFREIMADYFTQDMKHIKIGWVKCKAFNVNVLSHGTYVYLYVSVTST